MKKSDNDELSYAEKQSNSWIHFSEEWIQRQADEYEVEMKRQKSMKPLPSKLEFEKELRHHLNGKDLAQLSGDDYEIYRADVRERVRRKFLGTRIDATYKLGKSGGYQRRLRCPEI